MKTKRKLNKYFKNIRKQYGDQDYDTVFTLIVDGNDIMVIEDETPPLKIVCEVANGLLTDFEVMIVATNLVRIKETNPEVFKGLLEDLEKNKYPLLSRVKNAIDEQLSE